MPAGEAPTFPIIARLSAMALLVVAGAASSSAQPADHLRLGYQATFAGGSLDPSLDRFGLGPMRLGHSQDLGSAPSWTPVGGALRLEVTRPAALVGGVASLGVFATPVAFGQGTIFKASGTFFKPAGPSGAGTVWAIVVAARTGDEDDLFTETRVAATLQVRGMALRLNAPGAAVPSGLDLPPEIYSQIFRPTDPVPFTLELLVDRISGAGRVSLKVGDRVFSRTVTFPAFSASSGPAITTVGPSLGIASGAGQTASVQQRGFRLSLPPPPDDDPASCGAEWAGFHCRSLP